MWPVYFGAVLFQLEARFRLELDLSIDSQAFHLTNEPCDEINWPLFVSIVTCIVQNFMVSLLIFIYNKFTK